MPSCYPDADPYNMPPHPLNNWLGLPPIFVPAPTRYKDAREHRLNISTPVREDPTQVVCPRCAQKALILPLDEQTVRVVCAHCAFSQEADSGRQAFAWHDENPTDGYFGLHLWLQTRCVGHSLWAFNRRHLRLLQGYVAAQLREREEDEWGWRNASVVSRLPRWLSAKSNREAVLTSLEELARKA